MEQLLRNDELNVNSEFEVYQALYKWYCLDRKHRMNSMNKLIKFIRMTDIPLEVGMLLNMKDLNHCKLIFRQLKNLARL